MSLLTVNLVVHVFSMMCGSPPGMPDARGVASCKPFEAGFMGEDLNITGEDMGRLCEAAAGAVGVTSTEAAFDERPGLRGVLPAPLLACELLPAPDRGVPDCELRFEREDAGEDILC